MALTNGLTEIRNKKGGRKSAEPKVHQRTAHRLTRCPPFKRSKPRAGGPRPRIHRPLSPLPLPVMRPDRVPAPGEEPPLDLIRVKSSRCGIDVRGAPALTTSPKTPRGASRGTGAARCPGPAWMCAWSSRRTELLADTKTRADRDSPDNEPRRFNAARARDAVPRPPTSLYTPSSGGKTRTPAFLLLLLLLRLHEVRASAKRRRRGFKCRLEPGELYSSKGLRGDTAPRMEVCGGLPWQRYPSRSRPVCLPLFSRIK